MVTVSVYAQSNYPFNGLDMNMGNLSRLSDAKTRSISPENFTGEKGKGGMADPVRDKDQRNVANAHHAAKDLGKGWKVNPFIIVKPGETITIAEIEGPGAIQQIWMTPTGNWRFSILRMYWDDEKEPSVECPVGDFFCSAYNEYAQLSSLAVCVNPGSAFNCYWKMPFRKKAGGRSSPSVYIPYCCREYGSWRNRWCGDKDNTSPKHRRAGTVCGFE